MCQPPCHSGDRRQQYLGGEENQSRPEPDDGDQHDNVDGAEPPSGEELRALGEHRKERLGDGKTRERQQLKTVTSEFDGHRHRLSHAEAVQHPASGQLQRALARDALSTPLTAAGEVDLATAPERNASTNGISRF